MEKSTVNPMHRANAAPRCAARSKRAGEPCMAPAVRGKRVCRMHGAHGGAPEGKAHGSYRHGRFTCKAMAGRRSLAELLAAVRQTIAAIG